MKMVLKFRILEFEKQLCSSNVKKQYNVQIIELFILIN